MAEKNERLWLTIDERYNCFQELLAKCEEGLKNNPSAEDRKLLEDNKAQNEHNICLLSSLKDRLLQSPTFLFLIANQYDCKVLLSIPTYIETQDEAKFLTEALMRKYLEDNNIPLDCGSYVGIIVRKAFYDKLSKTEQSDVQSIFKGNNVHVISKEIIVSGEGISFI